MSEEPCILRTENVPLRKYVAPEQPQIGLSAYGSLRVCSGKRNKVMLPGERDANSDTSQLAKIARDEIYPSRLLDLPQTKQMRRNLRRAYVSSDETSRLKASCVLPLKRRMGEFTSSLIRSYTVV